jgi:predicted TIM-barrel fold metal-dependent hydrolase
MTHAPTINPDLRAKPPADLLGSLRRLHYDVAMSATTEQLGCLLELAGPTRVLFGSDYPFMPAEHGVENAAGFRAHGGNLERTSREAALALFPRFAR